MTGESAFRVRTRMLARRTDEKHRVSSPLELLFDLTFVAAIAQLVVELAHDVAAGAGPGDIAPFLMVFFAIWWAWMNFTWFASAYDTDDVLYRVLTLVQMAGVLVLAAGVPRAFGQSEFAAVTIGYFIMRVALVAQWVRAGVEHPAGRRTAFRYAAGISLVQAGWLIRLAVPVDFTILSFITLAALELSVPIWASRSGESSWHPHHIAERYGLFTIILLGESVLAATNGVQDALGQDGVSLDLVVISVASVALLFSLWWLYFLEPAGEGLEVKRHLSFLWGYGHFLIFASLAALGAGLEVAVLAASHDLPISNLVSAFAVAAPTAVFLVLLWALHAPLVPRLVISPWAILPAVAVVLALPFSADIVGLPILVLAIAMCCVGVIVSTIARGRRGHP